MATQKEKPSRLRSPAYPAIDLPTAIRRTEQFKEYAHKSAVTVSHVLEHWGYKGRSGNGMKIVAALGYYGLVDDTGAGAKRKIQLTDRAWRIIVDHEESDERAQAIINAAFSPKIYKEMWDEWGSNLPPDAEIRSYLIFDQKFNERAVNDLIADYKSTIEFAAMDDSDIIPEGKQEFSGNDMATSPSDIHITPQKSGPPRVKGIKSIEIPVPTTPWPILTVAFPMTEERWKQMTDMLNAMKPALVLSGDDEKDKGD